MLEKVPAVVGHTLHKVRAGSDTLVWALDSVRAPETITVRSSAFADGARIPARFTADGSGISPPLSWAGVPERTQAVVLIIEDADSPTPAPIVHLLAYDLGARDGELTEGALASPASFGTVGKLGKNSFRKAEFLPPDPPSGHGNHSYVFQVYALDKDSKLPEEPEKHDVVEILGGHVLARGQLTGIYDRPA